MERPAAKTEQKFGTNVLKIAVYIYTNKMLYGIIRVAFVLPGSIGAFSSGLRRKYFVQNEQNRQKREITG